MYRDLVGVTKTTDHSSRNEELTFKFVLMSIRSVCNEVVNR